MLKLLYITEDTFPPYRVDVVELFARQLVARGYTIDWVMDVASASPDIGAETQWLGSRVFLARNAAGDGLLGRVSRNLKGLLNDLRILGLARRGYHVIQVRDKFFAGLVAALAARLTKAKFVFWMSYPLAESKLQLAQNPRARYRWLLRLKGRLMQATLYRAILPAADHVFVQSERMRRDVAARGIDPARLSPVPMGIRADKVGVPTDARPPSREAPLLLHLGIILRIRSPEFLLRVLQLVRQRYPRASMAFVGEGQTAADRQALEAEVARLGLQDAVTITGFLPMEQAWEWVQRADVCISPFKPIPVLESTSPTKLIEYLAMAKCVVANEHPEQSLVMEESGAGRCVAWDEEAFAAEICRLLDEPAAAQAMAARGPEWVRRHRTYDVIAQQVDAAYRRLVGQGAAC
ncbi:glycosyltransferase [Azohydromonas caseinilytica]|uniref:Glycosyltransferase family 4 protein n=1 Tax=Azohydromonas caseinilytica TaxID=2728836 RepID=A0A848FH46_9BURK|nr:glycosyltransferase [Azohydromonas caseinilytica]NML17520.1 glycosyltransferase family 4 protein [Azohydromonas caseinilytica]